jgi:hypothetical protein
MGELKLAAMKGLQKCPLSWQLYTFCYWDLSQIRDGFYKTFVNYFE